MGHQAECWGGGVPYMHHGRVCGMTVSDKVSGHCATLPGPQTRTAHLVRCCVAGGVGGVDDAQRVPPPHVAAAEPHVPRVAPWLARLHHHHLPVPGGTQQHLQAAARQRVTVAAVAGGALRCTVRRGA